MSSDLAIELKGVSKNYKIYDRQIDRVKQFFTGSIKKYYREFEALKDLDLTIKKGTTLGILGRNGAGKSTLLQIICGTVYPLSGEVNVNGRIGALLELGSGFNPEFSGRENVILNGAILGLSEKEMNSRLPRILDFAGIGDFIDQPVKTYSSGMFIRLAFSVAINIDPEILIVDEALAVGDVQFQSKCFRKFEQLRNEGKTIIFVSHSPEQVVRHCDRAILLEHGKIVADGEPREITNQYLDLLFGTGSNNTNSKSKSDTETIRSSTISTRQPSASGAYPDYLAEFINAPINEDPIQNRPGYNKLEYRWGNRHGEICDVLISNATAHNINVTPSDQRINVYLKVKFHRDADHPIYGLTIKTPDGVTVYGTNSRDWRGDDWFAPQKVGDIVVVSFSLAPTLIRGHYLLSFGLVDQQDTELIPLDRRYDVIELYISNSSKGFGLADLNMDFALLD